MNVKKCYSNSVLPRTGDKSALKVCIERKFPPPPSHPDNLGLFTLKTFDTTYQEHKTLTDICGD